MRRHHLPLVLGAALAFAACDPKIVAVPDDYDPIGEALRTYPQPPLPILSLHFTEKPRATVFGDSSATGAQAVCAGTGCPSVVPGLIGGRTRMRRAVTFDGAGQCLSLGNPFDLKAPFTLSAFVAPHSLPREKQAMAIVAKHGASPGQAGWILGLRGLPGPKPRAQLALWRSSDGSSVEVATSNTILTVPKQERFTHVAVTVSAGGAYRIFVNGIEDANGAFTDGTLFASTAPVTVGCADGSLMPFDGTVDEIGAYPGALLGRDIMALWDYYRPADPQIGFTSNAPLLPYDGRVDSRGRPITTIDVARIPDLMREYAMSFYEFPLRRAPQSDLDSLTTLLENTKDDPTLKIRAGLVSWWYPRPYSNDYGAWIEALARLSLKYPNLEGVNFDDLFVTRADEGPYAKDGMSSFLDRDTIKDVCRKKAAINPRLKLTGVIYCDFVNDGSRYGYAPKKDQDLFVEWTADPEIDACITGAFAYTGPEEWRGVDQIAGCVDTIRVGRPNKEIIEGIYLSRLYRYDLSLEQRILNMEAARKTPFVDGVVFYTLPIAPMYDTETPELMLTLSAYAKGLARDPTGFFRW